MLKSSIVVTGFSLFAQLIGFFKLLLIANYFGVSPELDGYYLALAIPTLILGFTGGAIQTGFMPIYGKLLIDKNLEKALEFRSTVLWLNLLFLSILCLTLISASDYFIQFMVLSSDTEVEQYTSHAFKLLMFTLILNSVVDYFSFILNSHHLFYLASAAPIINVLITVFFLYLWPDWGVDNLIYGLYLGLAAQILIVAITLLRKKIHFRFVLQINTFEIKKCLQLMVPVLLGVALSNANLAIDQIMASWGGKGAVSTLGYASRFHNMITQTGIMGVSIVLLPTLITLISSNQLPAAFSLLRKLLFLTLIASMAAISVIAYFGEDVITLLLTRGEFTAEDSKIVYNIWFFYSLGIFPMAAGIFYAKLLQAKQKPWILTYFSTSSFLLNILLNWLFIQEYGVEGIALSTTVVYSIIALLLYLLTIKKWSRASNNLSDHTV